MTLKVIGAGFGRTGTMSLKLALEELGFGPCYHMAEVNAHPEHDAKWLALAEGKSCDWPAVFKGYASAVDWPAVYFWKELVAANPQAKIILTLRDPRSWYQSASATIFTRMREFEALIAAPQTHSLDPVRKRHMQMVNTIVVEKSFGGSLDRDHAIRIFNTHNEEVRRTVPAERLLVYEAGEGWGPLCSFLQVPVPATPYPKVNMADDFAVRFPDRR